MLKRIEFVFKTKICDCGTRPGVRIGLIQDAVSFTFTCETCKTVLQCVGAPCQFHYLDEERQRDDGSWEKVVADIEAQVK
jgi:hypothetical protein